MKRNKALIITAIVIFIGISLFAITFGFLQYTERQGKTAVTFHTIPSDATIVVDNKKITPGSTTYLKEGNYSYTISRDGFAEQTRSLSVNEYTDSSQFIMLEANSRVGTQWLRDNPEKTTEFESLAGQAAVERGDAARKKNPIIDDLPLKNLLFTIGYKNDTSDPSGNSIIVTVRSPEQYRQDAITRLSTLGHNLSDYKFEFYDMEDPFDEN